LRAGAPIHFGPMPSPIRPESSRTPRPDKAAATARAWHDPTQPSRVQTPGRCTTMNIQQRRSDTSGQAQVHARIKEVCPGGGRAGPE
jgi:hypothetical protein